jgi:dipeptidase
MWIAPRYPCIQPFIPWYYGITKISSDYEKADYMTALRDYNFKNKNYKTMYPDHACWVFDDFSAKVDSNYGKEIKSIREWKTKFEMDVLKTVKLKENEIINLYKSNPDKARQMLTDLTNNFAEKALTETQSKLIKLKISSQ